MAEETPRGGVDRRPWVFAAGLLGLLAVHAFADVRPTDGAWGAIGMLALSPAVRTIALLAAALLALPPLAQALASGRSRRVAAAVATTLGRVPVGWWIALLVALGWTLRSRVLYGDGGLIIHEIERGQLIYYKEPLDRLIGALVWRAGHALLGWDVETAIAVVSTAAGALYWAGVARLARQRPLAGIGGFPVWALLGTLGSVQLFFGHVESYSLLTAGVLWTLLFSLDASLEERRPLWPAGLVLGLTFATHLSAVWIAAAPLAAWASRHRHSMAAHRWRPALREALVGGGLSLLPFALVAAGMAIAGMPPSGFSAATFGGDDGRLFVPLIAPSSERELFTMFSTAHLAAFANELLLIAPVAALLALVGPLGARAAGRRMDAGTWVLLAAAIGALAYAFTFNPDLAALAPMAGVLAEWDLFAFAAVPLGLLGLWWLRTAIEPGRVRDGMLVSAFATGLVHTLAWLLHNAGVRL